MNNKPKKIVAFGNPLLDTVVLIQDDFLLTKYDLKPDGQKEITRNEMESLREDLKNYEKSVSAGGCAQNTLKVLQWLFHRQSSATIFGAIGNDPDGKQLIELLNQQGVKTNYIVHDSLPTGISVALALGQSRSLVACLGAAEVISLNDIESRIEISQLKDSHLVYMEGFFLTKRDEVASFILKYCNLHGKVLAFNLSGQYLCKEYPEQVLNFLENADIIFGSKVEFETVSSLMKETSVENLVAKLCKVGKTMVVTNGPNDVLCANGKAQFKVPVPTLKSDEVVDTTGAGDSFVAGFLAGYLSEKPLQVCVEIGCYAAQEIIKRKGCTIPKYPPRLELIL